MHIWLLRGLISLHVNSKFGDLLGRGGFEHLNTGNSTHLA